MNSRPSNLLRLALVAALGPACMSGSAILGGPPDAASSDAVSLDLGALDAGAADAGAADAGTTDAGTPDTGTAIVDAPAAVDALDAASVDVPVDVALDLGVDAPDDAAIDAPIDVAIDVGVDAPSDAGVDAPADAGVDAGADAGAACPAGSTAFMSRCYQAVTTIPPSTSPFNYWTFADTDCRTRFTGGHLVSIGSAMENTFVRGLVESTRGIMIGFADTGRAVNDFAWFDGSMVTYTNWNPGQPDNRTVLRFTSQLPEDYGLMLSDGAWYDVPYADGNPYVCKFPPPSPCPAGSSTFMGHCYQAVTTIPPSTSPFNYWTFADNDCRTRFTGGHLVSIGSAMENTFVRGLVESTRGIMIGFTDVSRAANDYAWLDGSTVTYTNWNPGQPDNRTVLRFTSQLTEDYGLMLSDGAWYDVPYADGNPYVCEF